MKTGIHVPNMMKLSRLTHVSVSFCICFYWCGSSASCWRLWEHLEEMLVTFKLCLTLSLPTLADRHKRSKASSRSKRLQITLAESIHLWTITLYEVLLWMKGCMLVHWLTALLSFLNWDRCGHHTAYSTFENIFSALTPTYKTYEWVPFS